MVAVPHSSPTSSRRAWSQLFQAPGRAFALTPLPILQGKVPGALRGTLFRNGPGRLVRGQKTMGHWFDGDGSILGVYFTETGVQAQYRYVETPYLQQEATADTLLLPNYGTLAPGPIWQRWGKPAKNSANTSVLPLGDRLLALWEAGKPYALDLQTLETLGEADLGFAHRSDTFSAHHKIHPATGEIYNFGVTFGPQATFQLYRCEPQGKIRHQTHFSVPGLKGLPLVHDFVLAGDYLVFCIPPVRLQMLPTLLGLKTVSEALQWRPELGTIVVIIDRHTLKPISISRQDPWFQWHFTNGFVNDQGEIVLEMVRFPDFASNQQFVEIPQGQIKTYTKGTLWRYHLEPKTAKVITANEICDRSCEFPITLESQTGQPWRKTFMGIHRQTTDIGYELINAIAAFDHHTITFTMADMGPDHYPSEPIPVQNPQNPDQIWLLVVVFNAPAKRSELRIYDGDRLDEEPLCTLEFPKIIPPSFHGKWQPEALDHKN
ncbi:retinal pigment epithelial membrane protein [[Synechococcus] sp. NIES-970]|nr:retinal pigment epithelial membrane protein [[Synechococcus] sp. NIES-970]